MRIPWTKQEEDYMRRRYLLQPVVKTAEKLNRSVVSVKRKAAKMGMSHYADNYNARTIADCFNSDIKVVLRWIRKFDLPCRRIECDNQTRYIVYVEDFWEWAENHKDMINWSKYEPLSICPEPDWLNDAVKNYATPRSRVKFTDNEIIMIKNMLHRGMGYKEIAERTGRSYYSINRLCGKIYM